MSAGDAAAWPWKWAIFANRRPSNNRSRGNRLSRHKLETGGYYLVSSIKGNKAEEISITRSDDGNVKVTTEYRTTDLPSPGSEVADKIIASLIGITHLESSEGKSQLALGIRDSSINLTIKMKSRNGGKKVMIKL
jgi:hypothetical protein